GGGSAFVSWRARTGLAARGKPLAEPIPGVNSVRAMYWGSWPISARSIRQIFSARFTKSPTSTSAHVVSVQRSATGTPHLFLIPRVGRGLHRGASQAATAVLLIADVRAVRREFRVRLVLLVAQQPAPLHVRGVRVGHRLFLHRAFFARV